MLTRRRLGAAFLAASSLLMAQRRYGNGRGLINRTINDLRRASRLERGGREAERYDNAIRHLADFERALDRDRFDGGRLDEAIDDLKHVIEHNTLGPRERSALIEDIRELRRFREREHRY
ncbi:MAG: hypothetical protein M3O35_05220 [Acidobacteriota bacterium]|nr:hypothetical protein [Acidobacteriota bacterium]